MVFVVRWLQTMSEKWETNWLPTEDQINNIFIPAMQGSNEQYVVHANKLQWPLAFIALMRRDIAETFEENIITAEEGCDCF